MSVATTRDGLSIEYSVYGKGAPLLLISGTGHDQTFWSGQLPLLSRHFKCIVFDNRGVGNSSMPSPGYSLADMAEDAIAVLDAEGINCVHLMGFSMGGHIAQELVLAHPDRVRSLGLHHTWARCDKRLESFQSVRKQLAESGNLEALIEISFVGLYEPHYFHTHSDELVTKKTEMVSKIEALDGWIGQLEACIRSNTSGRLQQIGVPTIVTCSDRDMIVSPYSGPRNNRTDPGSQITNIRGHWPRSFNRTVGGVRYAMYRLLE